MNGCRAFLGVIVAGLLVITAVLAIFIVNLANIITDRETIKQVLNLEQLFQEVGPELILNRFQIPEEASAFIPDNVDITAVQEAAANLLPPDWLNQQADGAVDDLYDFLETGQASQQSQTAVDIRPILHQLRAEPGRELIETTLTTLPPCPDPQPVLDPANLNQLNCRPTQVPVAQVAQVVHTAVIQTLDANAQLIEENAIIQIPLLSPNSLTAQQWQELQRVQRYFALAKDWAWLLWLPPILCLLILLFIVRSVGQWGHWWGWSLLLTGLLSLFGTLLLPAFVLSQLRLALPNNFGELQPMVNQLAQDLANQLLHLLLNQVYLQAGVALGAGVILIGIGFLFPGRAALGPAQSWQT